MNGKLQDWLHDLGVALGLIERPKLQPIPVRTGDDKRRQQRPRR
ncbi:MAG: PA1414 family protein [Pseudomonas sp.]